MKPVVIAGGGLSGSLAALALAAKRPELPILLLHDGHSFGDNHIWSFFDTDIPESSRWLIDLIARRRWPDHEIRFPARERVIDIGYNSVRSNDLDAAVRRKLGPEQYRLGARVNRMGPTHVLVGEERIEAECVIDARGVGAGGAAMRRLQLGWQKFVGRVYHFADGHGVERPVIMDARVAQIDGYRFLYFLPLTANELLIEDTYYSSSSLLDRSALQQRLDDAAKGLDSGAFALMSEEAGVLPIVIGGSLEDLWPRGDGVPRLGLAGGFFHPTTSYSLPDAVANAVLLAEQSEFSASAIHALLRGKAEKLWRQRRFFQLLNRMLFRAAAPEQRYRVLEHFYRLPPDLIARFYAADLTTLDKFKILSGKPPVPIRRALSAMRKGVA